MITDKPRSKCTVFPFHPGKPSEGKGGYGVVLWIPETIEELMKEASEQLNYPDVSCLLSEDAGKISDVHMINDGQKLYLISETQ